MPQIFHPSMNTLSRVSIFGAIFVASALLGIAGVLVRSPWLTEAGVVRPQPVPFSHQHHVGGIGIDCRFCHSTVEKTAFAGMPSTEVCLNCHSQLFSDSAMLQPVRTSFRQDEPIHWNRVHDLPDYVFFNHSIHVNKGIGCASCHGNVAKMPLMAKSATLHMEWCLDCHRHPEVHVRPRSDIFATNWTRDPEDPASAPGELLKDYHIRSQTNCSACHH